MINPFFIMIGKNGAGQSSRPASENVVMLLFCNSYEDVIYEETVVCLYSETEIQER